MPAETTDLIVIARGGVNYKLTLAEVVALASGGGGVKGTATISLPSGAGVIEWTETAACPGALPGDMILCQIAPGTDADENTAETIDLVTLSAVAGADEITFTITLSTPLSGPVLINWKAF